ncbi:homoserine kinase [Temperatibacter marinus]|uniref:Homoserine kinase n=1 Tax=Temperatibacter marinus TaxID=1456591 RepID=A0AA52EDA9_9PROT|nr:homoserine kinase [Temperatibacter marinus]WND02671.1 homoserine kinase [Temperatibacter marinus]
MAVYTQISDTLLKEYLSAYDVGEATSFKGIAEGIENSNYLLQTTTEKFILTIYEKRADPENLPYYLTLMKSLAEQGIKSPLPIEDRKGLALKTLKGKPCCMISFLNGVSSDFPNDRQSYNCGKVMAEMHKALSDFPETVENTLSVSGWLELFKGRAEQADALHPGAGAFIANQLAYLQDQWPSTLPRGTIHADLFPDNVLFSGDEVSGVIDFYFACTDIWAYDLAISLTAWCFDSENCFLPENATAMIAGYQSVRPLETEEKDNLVLLCQGASMRFYLTRLFDWYVDTTDALVKKKNPQVYLERLQHFTREGLSYGK